MTAFHGGGNGAGIDDVVAKVGPGVNARDHNIRTRPHQGVDAEVDTVRRRAHLHGDIAVVESESA